MLDKNKRVLVAGTGKSGIAATKLLIEKGFKVALYDDNKAIENDKLTELFGENADVKMFVGEVDEDILAQSEVLVISPGIPTDAPSINGFRDKGIKIIGEIELAYIFEKGNVVAITGTNGKTTTTSLVGEIMKGAVKNVYVTGNIGIPYTEVVSATDDASCTVLEVSSFQLETIETFRPKVSAILNITPDHLNRHYTMENYIKAKFDISLNQNGEDILVLNYEDEILRKMTDNVKAKIVYFSSAHILDEGVYLENDNIILKLDGEEMLICNIDELNLLGTHSYENVMAAVAMAWYMKVPVEVIREKVKTFQSVEHRIEYVCELDGVKYYNDSKGTNPDAAIKGITSMVRPTYLIGGGYDKCSDFREWVDSFGETVKELVLIGQTANQIAKTCDEAGFTNYVHMEGLKEAVEYCREKAEPGDAVLLSPACASWDMFSSYEERGNLFKKYVRKEA